MRAARAGAQARRGRSRDRLTAGGRFVTALGRRPGAATKGSLVTSLTAATTSPQSGAANAIRRLPSGRQLRDHTPSSSTRDVVDDASLELAGLVVDKRINVCKICFNRILLPRVCCNARSAARDRLSAVRDFELAPLNHL